MKNNEFESYLKDQHAKNYMGTDDDMPDAYEAWLENMDKELLLAYGDGFGAEKAFKAVKEFSEKLNFK